MTAPVVETTAAPAGTPRLNAAIARVQAEIPWVAKGESAKIEGVTKDGRPFSYPYKYAGLPECTAAILPLLGKNGLAFVGLPGINPADGKFGLLYKLKHESGEEEGGFWPLPSSGTPQQVGSALTYARRYCLCTVTGLAPGGDDDDALAGNSPQQYDRPLSAGDAFEGATPAPPRRSQAAAPSGSTTHPARDDHPAVSPTELDPDAQVYADEASAVTATAALKDIHDRAVAAHKLAALITNPATGGTGGLGQLINHRRTVLLKAERALKNLEAAGQQAGLSMAEIDQLVKAKTTRSIEEATAEDMDLVTADITALAAAGT